MRRLPYAYRFQIGLFTPHGRAVVTATRSEALQVTLAQFALLTTCPKSIVELSPSVRVPLGGPSTNVDCIVPVSNGFQSATASRSSIARSIAASAAYRPSDAF